jgi:hypothetical protein
MTFDPVGSMESDGKLGTQTVEDGSVGNCIPLASIKALSTTSKGEQILEKSVEENPDGSYDVQFAGDPGKIFHFSKSDMKTGKYGSFDDPYTKALAMAIDQYNADGGTDIGADGTLALLSGSSASIVHASSYNNPSDVEAYLATIASGAGSTLNITVSGNPGTGGKWQAGSKGIDHMFTITGINEQTGTITYTNPWNSTKTYSMSIADFSSQAAGTDVDIAVTQA